MKRLKTFIARHEKLCCWLCIIAFVGIMMACIEYSNAIRRQKILKNGAFTNTKFTGEIKKGGSKTNGPWYMSYYTIGDKRYHDGKPTFLCKKLGPYFFTQNFPVIYDSTNPELNEVLVFPFEFEDYKLQFPDSLNWVKYKME